MAVGGTSGRVLFSFRIAGVQEFIDRARTTEDFWASSYLISHLSGVAVDYILNKTEGELIFPAVKKGDLPELQGNVEGRFPNGILAAVPGPFSAKVGSRVHKAVRQRWKTIAVGVRDLWEEHGLLNGQAELIWKRQLKRQTFETYWAAVDWPEGGSYEEAYHAVSRLVEARKTLRNFACGYEPGGKCSQCGLLQALQDGSDAEPGRAKEYWQKAIAGLRLLTHRFRSGEGLCAVCVVCRLAKREIFDDREVEFPSTSSIAVDPFRARIMADAALSQQGVKWVESIARLAPAGRTGNLQEIDGDWFFESAYEPKRAEREHQIQNRDDLKTALQAFHSLKDAWREKEIGSPQGYVALLTADGDNVGSLINRTIREQNTVQAHENLSRRLSRISNAAARAVENDGCFGRMIYTGGDDLLALLPAATVLKALERTIAAIQSPEVLGPDFSISASVLIVPHTESLSGTIREGARLLKAEAKGRFQKGCVAFRIQRTSGQRTAIALPWKAGAHSALWAFRQLVEGMAMDPKESRAISPRMAGHFGQLEPGLREVDGLRIQRMVEQLLRRQTSAKKDSVELAEQLKAVEVLCGAASEMSTRAGLLPSQFLLDLLVMARFLGRMPGAA